MPEDAPETPQALSISAGVESVAVIWESVNPMWHWHSPAKAVLLATSRCTTLAA